MPLFSSGKKNPAELVKALHESLNIISKEQSGKKNEKVLISKKNPHGFIEYKYSGTIL